jgi:glucokinase
LLQAKFKVPVFVNNDANCFAVGERFFGDGRRFDDFIGLITGTGMGAGIIKWGRLLPDQNCGAGEFGMIPYLDQNYEYYASGQFFTNVAGLDGAVLAEKATAGDKEALASFEQYGRHLANAIKSILFALDPNAIIIGGSVSQSYPLYEKHLWNELQTFPYARTIERLQIMPSTMPEVSILGAAALCFDSEINS